MAMFWVLGCMVGVGVYYIVLELTRNNLLYVSNNILFKVVVFHLKILFLIFDGIFLMFSGCVCPRLTWISQK